MAQDVLPGTGRPVRFDPMKHGLYRRFVDGTGHIEHGQWLRAVAEGIAVGSCRRCGHDLRPERPHEFNATRTDYEATCRNDKCEWTCNAPGGRYLRYSSRLSERKSGS